MTEALWNPARSRRYGFGWLLALLVIMALYGSVAWLLFGQPDKPPITSPAAAPVVFEINVMAAPIVPPNDLQVDQLQQQSSPSPQQKAQPVAVKTTVKAPVETLTISKQSEVVLNTEPNEATEPVKSPPVPQELEEIQEPVEEPQETTTPEVTEQPPADTNVDGAATGEHQADQSSAPMALETQAADQPAAPAVGALTEQQFNAEADWQSRLQGHLERRKRYPRDARMRRQEGVPWVRFLMNRDGGVLDVQLYRSSGYASLDREALALLRRAEPLPEPPAHVSDQQLNIVVPIQFYIQ